jgi:peptide/nickel transport system substrate-binding protein/oligopeptide transport system substrate-binding protein
MLRSPRASALPLFAAALLACGETRAGNTLFYYESYDPRSLDPAYSTDVPTGEMVTLLYDCLTGFTPNGELRPGLADRWIVEEGGRRHVFHLRPGVRFHDGAALTPAHVRSSFLRVLAPQARGGRAWPLLPIAGAAAYAAGRAAHIPGIEVLGDTAVAFTLERPLAVFPKFLAMPVTAVVPDPAPADLAAHPIGTGPWRFVGWRHDDQLTFARNADYWDTPAAAETLVVRIIPEELTRAAEYESGRLSVVEIPFGETARWEQEHPDQLQRKAALRVVYVALNTRRGALRDARVRQAINHAVDVDAILATIMAGRGVRASGSVPPALPGSDTARAGYAFDPTRARALLAEAGHASGLDLHLWRSGTNVVLGRVAQAIQADLAKVGIRVELVTRDAASQREAARKGEADMAILDWWADYPDAENFLAPLFHSSSHGPGGNYAFHTDAGVDSLLDRAQRTLDDAARADLYRAIDERVYRAAPWLYLWFPVDLWAQHPTSTGWELPVIFNGQRWTGVTRRP